MELVAPGLVNVIALIAIISGLLLAGWWVIGFYSVRSRKQEEELPEVELPGHLHEVFTGVPPVLIILFVFTGITMVAYVLSVWVFGVSY